MMRSPVVKVLFSVVWFLTAVAAIHIGLMAMGYNMLSMHILANFAKPLEYIFGIAGVISLLLFFMHTATCKCNGNCTC